MTDKVKEGILQAAWNEVGSLGTDAIHAAWDKIEEFAEIRSIEFAEWIQLNGYTTRTHYPQRHTWSRVLRDERITTKELFQLFIQSKQ